MSLFDRLDPLPGPASDMLRLCHDGRHDRTEETTVAGHEAHDRVAEEYGDALPPGLAALDEAHAAHLADAIDTARRRQREALAEAMEAGLHFVPRLLRGPVKKSLFG